MGALSFHFLTTPTALFGESGGGISNAIVGTGIIVGIAALMAIPVGLLVAIYTTEFAPDRIAHPIRFVLDVLNGVPTIITGIFVYGLLVASKQQSGLRGRRWRWRSSCCRSSPAPRRRCSPWSPARSRRPPTRSASLPGARTVRVTLPTAAGGLLTGALLAVARVAGETAPLILTCSIFGQGLLTEPSEALASIPIFIFQASESPSPEAHTQAWAAALILIAFVLVLNVVARAFYARSRKRMGA